jgi:hypothetical protein
MNQQVSKNNNELKTHPYKIYAGLPINIFEKSSLQECFDINILNTQVEYYQKRNDIFLKTMEEYIKKWIDSKDTHVTAATLRYTLELSNRVSKHNFQELFERYNWKFYLKINDLLSFLKRWKNKLLWNNMGKPTLHTRDDHSLYTYKWIGKLIKWNQWSEINRWYYVW